MNNTKLPILTKISQRVAKNQTLTNIFSFVLKYNIYFIFLLMMIIAASISDVFFTEKNLFNLLRQAAGLGIVSMGMLIVILTGGIDLSVGSIAALCCVLEAHFLSNMGLSLLTSVLLSLLIGLVCGLISGILVARYRLAPFIATLAMMTIARGMAYILSDGSPIMVTDEGLMAFGSGYLMGIPYPVYLMLIIVIIITLVLNFTSFGRLITAIGSNEAAVRLAGIRVTIYKVMVYGISGVFCAMAGIISVSRTGVGSPLIGQGMELDAIASVVIGGASLSGGRGKALNTFFGVLILGMISNILNLMNVPGYPQQVVKGLIIVGAVMIQGLDEKNSS